MRPDTHKPEFRFQPRWKEELVCECDLGSLVLDLTMGVPTVYLPNEQVWPAIAPDWAKPHWQSLHDQLQAWCSGQNIPLQLSDW
jgi:hypothetical protein